MDEVLIVPDIHGRDFWKPALKYKGKIIFLGDYTDPYPCEEFEQEDAYQSLLQIVEFKQENPERVTLLIGNHEMHYYNEYYACSRFDFHYFDRYNAILMGKETSDLFQVCKQIDNYLFIHAGIIKGWYDVHLKELSKLGKTLEEQLNKFFFTNRRAFFEVSRSRGGYHSAGSPLWADLLEHFNETVHFNNEIIQIIGHTRLTDKDPVIMDNVWMLDNQKLYLLKNNELEKYIV
ncbi:MAG: metallophosphoesterase [Bacteroidales bacterium]|jgi:hypothetical protein|nr:metallophosphoesterase [Bacteroidales bacterium]